MKTVTIFSNIGVGEAHFADHGFQVELACELDSNRCQTYRKIYTGVNVICGDITKNQVKDEYCGKAKGAYLLIATPPCQGFSTLNRRKKDDPRNKLVFDVIDVIKKVQPNYVLLENVPEMLTFKLDNNRTPPAIMRENLSDYYDVRWHVLNAKDYATPQNRERAIVLMTRKGKKKWRFPAPTLPVLTLRRAIWNLPSLESGEQKGHPLHYAHRHSPRQVEFMRQTPEGQSAQDNMGDDEHDLLAYMPNVVEDGKRRRVRAFPNSYMRMKWDEPAPTFIQNAHNIGSSTTVHPGRRLADGTQSDARTLSILEGIRVMGLPDDWPLPHDLSYVQSMRCLGEGFCPRVVEALVRNIAR